VVNREKIIF